MWLWSRDQLSNFFGHFKHCNFSYNEITGNPRHSTSRQTTLADQHFLVSKLCHIRIQLSNGTQQLNLWTCPKTQSFHQHSGAREALLSLNVRLEKERLSGYKSQRFSQVSYITYISVIGQMSSACSHSLGACVLPMSFVSIIEFLLASYEPTIDIEMHENNQNNMPLSILCQCGREQCNMLLPALVLC